MTRFSSNAWKPKKRPRAELFYQTPREKPKQGKVLSLGEGKVLDNGKRSPFQVKKGDKVLFTSYAGSEVTIDGKEYLIMTEDDILAIAG